MDILVNFALNLAPKSTKKSTQELLKINKKSFKNNVQHMIRFFIDFDRFWTPLGFQVGPMLTPCWPQNLKKKATSKTKQNKWPYDRGAEEGGGTKWWRVLGVLNSTENSFQYRDARKENMPSQLALWPIWFSYDLIWVSIFLMVLIWFYMILTWLYMGFIWLYMVFIWFWMWVLYDFVCGHSY